MSQRHTAPCFTTTVPRTLMADITRPRVLLHTLGVEVAGMEGVRRAVVDAS